VSDLAEQLAEDKALRDAALQLFKSDIGLVRGDLGERSVGARAKDRLGEAALGMLDDAIDYAEDNKGWVAAGTAAVVVWFARRPILGWVAGLLEDDDGGAEPGEADGRCEADSDSTGEVQ
jgi:hypothetical protein